MSLSFDPASMSPAARVEELAVILAAGLLRLPVSVSDASSASQSPTLESGAPPLPTPTSEHTHLLTNAPVSTVD